jgi:hypothetical protein
MRAEARTGLPWENQYLVVANPTLLNGNLDLPQGWLTEGTVDFTNGAAILRETLSQQHSED